MSKSDWTVYDGPMVDGDDPCPVCGRPIPRRGFTWQGDGKPCPTAPRVKEDGAVGWRWVGHSGRGRPRAVCGRSCQDLRNTIQRIGSMVEGFPGDATIAATLRGDLWSAANRLNRKGGIRKRKK